jgi:hypothetical protein
VEVTDDRAWFIDAWAVRDGAAFASFRHRNALDATNTVFLAVPALQPTPVGRITTALGATRYCFQDRFHDDTETEIAFESLAQIQELIRRAYIASGIGPGGTAGPIVTLPRPEPGGTGGAYYENAVAQLPPGERRWFAPGLRLEPLRNATKLKLVVSLVTRYAEATLLEWEQAAQRVKEHSQRQRADASLREWYVLLMSRGFWHSASDFMEFVNAHKCYEGIALADGLGLRGHTRWPVWIIPSATAGRQFSDQQLAQTSPCALRKTWDPNIRRLTDKLFLAIGAVEYFDTNPELPEVAPALLGALVCRTARGSSDIFGGPTSAWQAVSEALDWLERELPSSGMPPAAENMLTRYAWEQLKQSGIPQ